MQFSTQQMAGGAQYGPRTRVGNWFEDIVLQEERYAEFRKKKESGQLAIGFRSRRFNLCLQKVPLTFSADGKLRFGDTITIANPAMGATLANTPYEEVLVHSNMFSVTASPDPTATARSTFVITRLPSKLQDPIRLAAQKMQGGSKGEEDVLHYGQPFQLATHPALRVDDQMGVLRPPLFLCSAAKTGRCASKWSNRQLVYMADTPHDYNSVWTILRPAKGKLDGVTRQLCTHEAVRGNEGVVLVHANTNKPLAVDPKYGESTDFGREHEVVAHSFTGLGKNELVAAEMRGDATGLSITKPELANNVWVLGTASSPPLNTTNPLPPPARPEAVVKCVLAYLWSRGLSLSSLWARLRPSQGSAGAGVGKVEREDVKWALKQLSEAPMGPSPPMGKGPTRAPLPEEAYLDLWLDSLDAKKDGMLRLSDVQCSMWGSSGGPLGAAEAQGLVQGAWEGLRAQAGDKANTGTGTVPLSLIIAAFHPKALPKVQWGVCGSSSALEELKLALAPPQSLTSKAKDSAQHVAFQDFLNYHKDLAVEVGDEEAMGALVKEAWAL